MFFRRDFRQTHNHSRTLTLPTDPPSPSSPHHTTIYKNPTPSPLNPATCRRCHTTVPLPSSTVATPSSPHHLPFMLVTTTDLSSSPHRHHHDLAAAVKSLGKVIRERLVAVVHRLGSVWLLLYIDKGLGYNVIPPPYTRNFMPPKPDLVYPSLDNFVDVNESVSESVVKKPTVESNESKTVRIENAAPIIKDWVFESEEEDKPKFQTVKPIFTKIEFVKPKTNRKPVEQISGCFGYMTGNRSYLTDYEEIDRGFIAFGGNSKGEKITGKCKIRTGKLDFEDVYFVKELKFNLFSILQMCDKNNSVLFTDTACVVLSPDFKLTNESHVLLKVPRKDNMYSVDLKNVVPQGGKFEGKADEGFFVGYSTNNKAFRVFISSTRIVEENMHVKSSENTPNIAGSGPNWLFDIDTLTKSMNYKPVVAGNQSNGSIGIKACDNVGKTKMVTVHDIYYILLPLWAQDPPFSYSLRNSLGVGFKPSGEEEKKDAKDLGNKDSEVSSKEEPRINQEKDSNVNRTNNINTVSPTDNAAGIEDNVVDENIVYGCADDPNILDLEETDKFGDAGDDDSGTDMNNLDTNFQIDVKSTFLYGNIEEEVYVCQPPSFEDPDFPDKVYKVEKKEDRIFISQDKYVNEILTKFGISDVKTASMPMETHKTLLEDEKGEDVDEHVYRSMIGSLMIFRYLKGLLKLGLWYPKDSPFDLVAYTNNDYAGASLDRKSTIEGCQFLGCRLISWQCKKQTMVANSIREADTNHLDFSKMTNSSSNL
uniref:Putative ribonuclease H-like domain-containing protein n=1 Tax=Tanacetum cinerariifolium TaxID=118510 RepID=A0A6L2K4D9_TANCI|nr:putative ribonuclease H-like domain-containing protein [Tanacetum cinerariifolium]